MKQKFLNTRCNFYCSANVTTSIIAQEPYNMFAKDACAPLLTTAAVCSPAIPAVCPLQPQQLPCWPQPVGVWQGAAAKVRCRGRALLTTASSLQCMFGGIIRVRSGSVHTIAGLGGAVRIQDIAEDQAFVPSARQPDVPEGSQCRTGQRRLDAELEGAAPQASSAADGGWGTPEFAAYACCRHKSCGKRGSCQYFMSKIDQDTVNNDAAKLRKNFRMHRRDQWDAYVKRHRQMLAEAGVSWGIAMHHIIPGKQVMLVQGKHDLKLKYGKLLKLMEYCSFDVNYAGNGILLPTKENSFGPGEREKRENAEAAMERMKRQWHVGGHKVSLNKSEMEHIAQYCRQRGLPPPPPDFNFNYVDLVGRELLALINFFPEDVCWAENRALCQKLLRGIQKISRKVEKYLLAFEEDPHLSAPYFVSKRALQYVYRIPAIVKVVVIYMADGRLWASKMEAAYGPEHFSLRELKTVPVGEAKTLIRFCENTMHFLIDTPQNYALPFADAGPAPAIGRICLGEETVMECLIRQKECLLEWLESNDFPEQPVRGTILKRGG